MWPPSVFEYLGQLPPAPQYVTFIRRFSRKVLPNYHAYVFQEIDGCYNSHAHYNHGSIPLCCTVGSACTLRQREVFLPNILPDSLKCICHLKSDNLKSPASFHFAEGRFRIVVGICLSVISVKLIFIKPRLYAGEQHK